MASTPSRDPPGERKFTKGLSKPGSAAAVRETVTLAVRQGTSLSKPKKVEPVDYESFVSKNRTVLEHDLLKDMIFIPEDAFEINNQPRMHRTTGCPTRALLRGNDACDEMSTETAPHLLVESSVAAFVSDWTTVDFKWDDYGGNYLQLPKGSAAVDPLREHAFEVDAELDAREDSGHDLVRAAGAEEITKKGYLQKGPETRGDVPSSMAQSISISFHPKSFKRRFFCLKQQVDQTYILEYHRDDKKNDPKASIYLDSCVDVQRASRRGKLAFELIMQDDSRYVLAAESEADLEEWIAVLKRVIQTQEALQLQQPPEKLGSGSGSNRDSTISQRESLSETLSKHPELVNYARENDDFIAECRRKERQNLFTIYPEMKKTQPVNEEIDLQAEMFDEPHRFRLAVSPKELKFRLQASLATLSGEYGAGGSGAAAGKPDAAFINPEPFFVSLALFDAKRGSKLTENFYFDPNHNFVRHMIPKDIHILNGYAGQTPMVPRSRQTSSTPSTISRRGNANSVSKASSSSSLDAEDEEGYFENNAENSGVVSLPDAFRDSKYAPRLVDQLLNFVGENLDSTGAAVDWIAEPQEAVFSVSEPHSDVFLVVRVEKVLQGALTKCLEPYLRSESAKAGNKVYRQMKGLCNRIGNYRMPFAWSIRPLFDGKNQLNQGILEIPLFRQEAAKFSDEGLIKFLTELHEKPEKMTEKLAKLSSVHGYLKVSVRELKGNASQEDPSTPRPSLLRCLNPSYVPLSPFPPFAKSSRFASHLCLETQEFSASRGLHVSPFTSYRNHIYVYPRELKFDNQKVFPRARNIACILQVRDSDEPGSMPLRCIYARPGPGFSHDETLESCVFTTSASTNVLHHDNTPEFYDEIKIRLPANLHHKHHLLFTFFHVSCEGQKKTNSAKRADSVVGYAWIPLLRRDRVGGVSCDDHMLKVAVKLPEGGGYLSQSSVPRSSNSTMTVTQTTSPLQRTGSTHSNHMYSVSSQLRVNNSATSSISAPSPSTSVAPSADSANQNGAIPSLDMKGVFYSFAEAFDQPQKLNATPIIWVDPTKPLFRVSIAWSSSVYTTDPHLHAFFEHCGMLNGGLVDYVATDQLVKALHAVEISTVVRFLCPLLNQLFQLLCRTALPESVALQILRLLVHILGQLSDLKKSHFARAYVKYVFDISIIPGRVQGTDYNNNKTIHEELIRCMRQLLDHYALLDTQLLSAFFSHAWFFFHVSLKSMAQFLQRTGRSRDSHRDVRFPQELHNNIMSLFRKLCDRIRIHSQRGKSAHEEGRIANKSMAQFVKRAFSFMDRGFLFKVINEFVDEFLPGDPKPLFEYKFEFLRIIALQEHFIPLNLPVMRRGFVRSFPELQQEFCLTEKFCRTHFLVGILLKEIQSALREVGEIRLLAIHLLRNILAKHSYDDRYRSTEKQARVASLYVPFIQVILENKPRLMIREEEGQELSSGSRYSMAPLASPEDTGSKRQSYNGEGFDIGSLGPPPPIPEVRTTKANTIGSSTPTASGGKKYTGEGPPSTPGTPKPHLKSSGRESSYLAMIAGSNNATIPNNSTALLTGKKGGDSMSSLNSSESFPSSSEGLASPRHDSVSYDHVSATPLTSPVTDSGVSVLSETRPPTGPFRRGLQRGSGAYSQPNSTSNNVESPSNTTVVRFDKFEPGEIRDLLICFLHIVKSVNDDVIIGWWTQASEYEILDFFGILEICLHQFRYRGRQRILTSPSSSPSHSPDPRSQTLPPRTSNPLSETQRGLYLSSVFGEPKGGSDYLPKGFAPTKGDLEAAHRVMQEGNLSSEVGTIVLDIVSVYMSNFKEKLEDNCGDNTKMRKIFDILISLLHSNLQSEMVVKHAFASLRAYVKKFPSLLFHGNPLFCRTLCYELLRSCNACLSSTRSEACGLLYLLMRSNFEFSKRRGFTRVHLQVIIAVSQLISENVGLSGTRFQESLSFVNSYANSDRHMQVTSFPSEVKDLTKRIRTILMATSQMKYHKNDPEMLVDLQYSLAKSYASTPELRKTWLDSIAKIHITHGNYSEAALCYIHIAALIAEFLRRRGLLEEGGAVFSKISPNIVPEEMGVKDDVVGSLGTVDATGLQEQLSFSDLTMVEQLETAKNFLVKGERFEALGELFRIVLPVYEKHRNFVALAEAYKSLHLAYQNVNRIMTSGKRYLGRFFRVAFYGQPFFEEEDGKEYIYKEPKVTSLTEISNRLWKLYGEKLGQENVRLIMDSKKVDAAELDPKFAHLQVTFVEPYFDAADFTERVTYFEKNHNIRRFVYETPFTKDEGGRARAGNVDDQWLRQTILTTDQAFPFVKKRIVVVYREIKELSPIEVAILELKRQAEGLSELSARDPPDLVQLQLRLQGSVAPQVNAGVLAYVSAFLSPHKVACFDSAMVDFLRDTFLGFLTTCANALEVHCKHVPEQQEEYHASLVQRFDKMRSNVAEILGGGETRSDRNGPVANLAPVADNECVDRLLGPDSCA